MVADGLPCGLEFEDTMAVFEGWTFAAARGASRKSLFQIAEASKIGPGLLENIEQARDIDLADSRFDIAAIERVVEVYGVLGFRILPRTLLQAACLKRVQ
jgi:hypothetical protein